MLFNMIFSRLSGDEVLTLTSGITRGELHNVFNQNVPVTPRVSYTSVIMVIIWLVMR